MQHFFVPAETLARQPVTLTGEQARQVQRVLRMRPGEHVTLLDNRGAACEAVLLSYGKDEAHFQTLRRWQATGEPSIHITLYQAVLKGEHFIYALQKATEVGVSAFVPMICERNVVDDLDAIEGKRPRWQRILQEAAEQSGRGRIPTLAAPQLFADALSDRPAGSRVPADAALLRLIPWEEEHGVTLRDALVACNLRIVTRIQVYIGPEGGFSTAEIELARLHGVRPVSLGARILRAETAGVVAAAAILYEAGEI
jgi:16S rRNA (uracil1498-N3)-methyltransferase